MTLQELIAGLQTLGDLGTALADKLSNVPADEAVLNDGAALLALVNPAAVPVALLLPVAELIIAGLIANNQAHQQRLDTVISKR